MKLKLFIIAFLLLCFDLFAQSAKDKVEYSKALSYFATGNSFNSVGNYASLSTANNTLTASLFFLDDNRGMYTVDVKAGATQGFFTLFDEGKLNSNVSIGVSYRFLFGKEYVGYNIPDQSSIDKQISTIETDYIQKRIELLNKLENPSLTAEEKVELDEFIKKTNPLFNTVEYGTLNVALHKEKLKKLKKVNDLYKKVVMDIANNTGLVNTYTLQEITELRKSLEDERKKLKADIVKNNKKTLYALADTDLINAMNSKKSDLKKKMAELKPRLIRLNFLSIGYKATNSKFVRFIDDLEPENQLKNIDYTSHNVKLSYNFVSNVRRDYKVATYKYLSIGADFTYTDNQSSLQQVDVEDISFLNDEETRVVSKSQKAFFGDYIEDLSGVTTFIDYYSFFSKVPNLTALHINPTVNFKENQKPIANMQFGLLIPFTKKEDNKSVVNVEIFYRFKDVFNNLNSDNTLLNRNIIGLQTSFPFNL